MSLKEFGTDRPPSRPPASRPPQSNVDILTPNLIIDEPKREPGDACQWVVGPNGHYIAASVTVAKLPPCAYGFWSNSEGIHFVRKNISVDQLLNFPDSKHDKIISEIQKFWDTTAPFRQYGFLHRRGYLLYGPPGGGKSCLVHQIVSRVIEDGDIVFVMDCAPSLFRLGLQLFRRIEPERRVVCVFEDVDSIIQQHGDNELLSLLDGENQVDHVLNLGTTNYPERLDPRIVGRPRRFDSVIKIGMPTKAMREAYFTHKFNLDKEDIDTWVEASAKLSFAALSELVISVKCLGNDFDATIKKLREMALSKPDSKDDTSQSRVGFNHSDIDVDD